MLPQGSLGFLIRTSSDWSRGFSSYHSKMGKHIAKSSSLTSSLFLHLQCLSFHSSLALCTPILILHTCNVALVNSLSLCHCHSLSFHSSLALCTPILILHTCNVALVNSLSLCHCHSLLTSQNLFQSLDP